MKIRILPDAIEDLEVASDYYELQVSGLGAEYMEELTTEISQLAVHGGVHRLKHGFHFKVSKRFPFAIFYLVEDGQIDVYAVVDCRQAPSKTLKRLNQE